MSKPPILSDVTDAQLDARARAVAKMKSQRMAPKIRPILVGEEIAFIWCSDEDAEPDDSNDN